MIFKTYFSKAIKKNSVLREVAGWCSPTEVQLPRVSLSEPGAPEPAPWPWALRPTLWDQPGPCPLLPNGLQVPRGKHMHCKLAFLESRDLCVLAVARGRWWTACLAGGGMWVGAGPPVPPTPARLLSAFFSAGSSLHLLAPFLSSLHFPLLCSASPLCLLSSLPRSLLLFGISPCVLSLLFSSSSPLCGCWTRIHHTLPLPALHPVQRIFPLLPPGKVGGEEYIFHLFFSLFCSCTPDSGLRSLCV